MVKNTVFYNKEFRIFVEGWGMYLHFKFTHVPVENGIEYSHRNMKKLSPEYDIPTYTFLDEIT